MYYIITCTGICICGYWLFNWCINVFIGLIMSMKVERSCFQRRSGDSRLLPIFYQVFVYRKYCWSRLISNDILLKIRNYEIDKHMFNILIDIRFYFTPITWEFEFITIKKLDLLSFFVADYFSCPLQDS